ncbi:MAG TPA: hypothetical protein VIC28_03625 [Thermoanaerobaculia bacterium]|jgi:hypothetical protein
MLGNRTFLIFLLAWLTALGVAPALLKSRPEPIEIEPPPLAAAPGAVSPS